MITKACGFCEMDFETKDKRTKYCSSLCKDKSNRPRKAKAVIEAVVDEPATVKASRETNSAWETAKYLEQRYYQTKPADREKFINNVLKEARSGNTSWRMSNHRAKAA